MHNLLPIIFQAALTLIVLLTIAWQVALVYVVFAPLFIWVLLRGSLATQQARKAYHESYDEFAAKMTQGMTNIRTGDVLPALKCGAS